MDNLSDEADDIADQYEQLEKSHWNKKYHKVWAKATTNP